MSPAGSEFNRKKKLTTRDVTFNSYMMYGGWGLGVGVGVGGCGFWVGGMLETSINSEH